MTDVHTSKWLSAYLYYNEPWETFLVEAVEPYIKTVMQTGIAEQYFFIRYWDRGPHIRLRFKADSKVVDTILRPNLEEHFLSYYDSKPSHRKDPNYPDSFPDHFRWLPNNSIEFVDYEPETRRYGGLIGAQIAEFQFQGSSDIALHCLKSRALDWSYDDALGAAIKLHLAFVSGVGMNMGEATSFFHFLYHNWLPRSFRYYHKKLTREAYDQQAQELTTAFAESFELQKEALVPFHQAMWEALESKEEFEEPELNIWIKANQLIKIQLDSAAHRQELKERSPEEQYTLFNNFALDPQRKLLWSFYGDYFHMTNNRLGILNRDEGFLGYLMMKSLHLLSEREQLTVDG